MLGLHIQSLRVVKRWMGWVVGMRDWWGIREGEVTWHGHMNIRLRKCEAQEFLSIVMSVCMDDTNSCNSQNVSDHQNKTMYRKVINELQSKIKEWAWWPDSSSHLLYTCSASGRRVHIYSFNVCPEQLESAHTLLDKEEEWKSIRLVVISSRGPIPDFFLGWHTVMITTSSLGTCQIQFIRRPMPTGSLPFFSLLCDWHHCHML